MIKKFKKSIGIDVSDFSIELVELEKHDDGIRIAASNRIILEPGVIEQGEIRDLKKLQKVVKNLFSGAKPKSISGRKVIFSLPDNQIYTSVFRVKISENKGIKQAIENEIKNNIPLAKDEISYAYKVIKEEDKKTASSGFPVVLIAVKKSFLHEWNDFFASIGISIDYFETESLSLFRGIFEEHPSRPIGILDIGASRSHFSIFGRHGIEYAFSSALAGNLITGNIAKELNKNFQEAERIKMSGKIDGQELDLFAQLEKVLKPLFDEVNKTVNYYNSGNLAENSFKSDCLDRVLITGGSSNIKNIINFINQRAYSYKTELGSGLFKGESADNNHIQAIGSAIRGLDDKWEITDPFLSLHNHEARKMVSGIKSEFNNFFDNRLKPISKKIIIWLAVALLILSLIFIAPIFKNTEKPKNDNVGFHGQSFQTYLDILGGDGTAGHGIFKARVLSVSTDKPAELGKVLEQQKTIAATKLTKGELLSPEPINKTKLAGALVFPLTLEWLAYDEEEIKAHCLKQGKMKFLNTDIKTSSAYITNLAFDLKTKKISGTGYCEVVSGSDMIERKEIKKETPPKQAVNYIKINPIGSSLNIRSGPAVSYAVVASGAPGTEYEILEEKNGWIKIRIVPEKEAWVNANFVKKIVK